MTQLIATTKIEFSKIQFEKVSILGSVYSSDIFLQVLRTAEASDKNANDIIISVKVIPQGVY